MSLIVQNLAATRKIVDPTDYSLDFLDAEPHQVSDDEPNTTDTEWEMEFDVANGVAVHNDYFVDFLQGATTENLSPSIATLTGNVVTRVADGFARVKATFASGSTKSVFLDMRETAAATYRVFTGYVSNSMPDLLANSVLDLVTPGKTASYYSTFDHATSTYVRDAACWAAGLNLTGCPVASDIRGWGPENRGAAVTTRHVVGAKHWNVFEPAYEAGAGYSIGNRLRFAESDGTVHERGIIGRASFRDLIVVTLDSALPVGITPLPIVGEWYFDSQDTGTPGIKYGYSGGMAFYLNQLGQAKYLLSGNLGGRWGLTMDNVTVNDTSFSAGWPAHCVGLDTITNAGIPSFLDGKMTFYREGIGGDSGSAVMALVDGIPSLLWTWWSATSGIPVWTEDGAFLNALIAKADSSAGISTGLSVTVTPDPTI